MYQPIPKPQTRGERHHCFSRLKAQFQSAGLRTKAQTMSAWNVCLWLGRVVLFDELVRGTPAVDFFKI